MATTVGEASIKLSFDSSTLKSSMSKAESVASSQAEKAGKSSGAGFANAWTVAAGNLIAKGVEKVVSVIENNLGAAIKRVDTMNNFPRVMSNLGISADEAAEVVQDLAQKLRGLPTTLDGATSAVQRFTSVNGDVKKSEKIFLAVNDAILAGGGSAEIQSAAMEQLSQAYAKGKPDMQEWRSIQTAMPAQLEQVAKKMLDNGDAIEKYLVKARKYAQDNPLSSTAKELIEQLEAVKNGSGNMSTALGTALRTGIISMDEFTDALIDMDETGVAGFASLSQQAKDATAGIGTSMENVRVAVVRAIEQVINQIGSGRIQSIANGIIQIIGNVGDAVGNVVSWIIDHHEIVISALAGIGAAIATAFVAEKIISFITTLKNVIETIQLVSLAMTGTTGLLPAIQAVVAGFMGPVGIAVAIAGVVAAIATFIAVSSDGNKTMSETDRFVESSRAKLNEYKNSWDEVKDAQQKQIDAGLSEMSYYESLVAELGRIVDENGKVKDGYETRAKFITETLSNATGVEIKLIDGIVQGYSNIKGEIDKVIASKKAKIILDAQEEAYTEAIKNQQAVMEELGRATANLEAAKTHLGFAEDALTKAQQEGDQAKINSAQAWVDKYTADVASLQSVQADWSAQYQQHTFTIQQYEDNLAAYTEGRYNDIKNSTWSYVDTLQDSEQAQASILEEDKKMHKGFADYSKMLWETTGNERYRIDSENWQKLYDKDVEGMNKYNAATESGLTEVHGNWSTFTGRIINTVESASKDLNNAGKENMHFYELGVDSKKQGAYNAGQRIGDMTVGGVKSNNQNAQNAGGSLGDLTVRGINENNRDASNAGKALGTSIVDATRSKYKDSTSAGGYLVDGLTSGANAQSSALYRAASSIAASAIDTIKRVFKINSPSKVTTEIGEYFSQGLGIGIEKEARDVIDKAEQLGQDVTATIAEATADATIDIPLIGDGITSGSAIAQAFDADINGNFESESASSANQPLVVELQLDGQQIQRVFLQDIRRSTI